MKTRILILSVLSSLMSALLSAQPAIPQLQAPVPDSFGYTSSPDTTGIGLPVGTSAGAFAVSPLGGATYSIAIECPPGVNGLQPQITVTYNSQAGNGIAGYGCNVSGISCITRGPRDIYHDGQTVGMKYDGTDAFSLDGTRLLLQSGTAGAANAAYTPEGSLLDTVLVHTEGGSPWFGLQSSSGMYYEYGHGGNGIQNVQPAGQSSQVPASWYVTHAEDAVGNFITYGYTIDSHFVYPSTITYSCNDADQGATTSTVVFEYEERPDPQSFYSGGTKVTMDWRLKSVTTKTGTETYRKYLFTYDTDPNAGFSRLCAVNVRNGSGEELPPTEFTWEAFPSASRSTSTVDFTPQGSSTYLSVGAYPVFMSGDMNGDGISDIIQLSNVGIGEIPNQSAATYSFISFSSLSDTGVLTFSSPVICRSQATSVVVSSGFLNKKVSFTKNIGPMIADFDGDGLNEYIVPSWNYSESGYSYSTLHLYFFKGCDIRDAESGTVVGFKESSFQSRAISDKEALHVCSDFNNDGRTEILTLEHARYTNAYDCHIFYYKHPTSAAPNDYAENVLFQLSLPSNPRHLFASDMNSDGLTDIVVFYQEGYRIFYNQGGIWDTCFSDSHASTSSNVTSAEQMFSGDFNGDGKMDILLHDGLQVSDKGWYIGFNNGNGFSGKSLACTLNNVSGNNTGESDEQIQCLIADFNGDGKSDVFVNRGRYNFFGGFIAAYSYWLKSNGTELERITPDNIIYNEYNGRSAHFLTGSFTGKGQQEIMNYGLDCYGVTSGGQNGMHLYTASNTDHKNGKVSQVTDGMGIMTEIAYGNLSNSDIYHLENNFFMAYPVVIAHIPLTVVASATISNGAAGSAQTGYEYADLFMHQTGRGLIGYAHKKETDITRGIVKGNKITEFYIPKCLPTSLTSYIQIGNSIKNNYVYYGMVMSETGNYNVYPTSSTTWNFDGDGFSVSYQYDLSTLLLQSVHRQDEQENSWEETVYSNYTFQRGIHLPTVVSLTKKHRDSNATYNDVTLYSYDSHGQPVRTVHHAGTAASYVTLNTYDDWGNLTATVDSGHPTIRISHVTEYDATHRFPAATYIQTNNGTIAGRKQYTYDTWGNMLTETDLTNTAQPLTTTHAYDGWGNRLSTTAPTGHRTQYDRGRTADGYFTLRRGISQPWVKTTYDSTGRELSTETRGAGGIVVKTTNSYDTRGRLHTKTEQQGERTLTTSYTYDARDRITQVSDDTGSTSTFSYGLRSSTETIGGRTYTKTYDAWGNVKTSSDPVATVSYLYNSQGLPRSVTTAGSTVTMTYDQAGRRLTLTDPDAGTMTTAYDVLGNITRQTDARGKTVTYTYDKFGREQRKIYDGNSIARTYGTSGNSAMRLSSEYNTGMSVSYAYDGYGRIVSETRTADNSPRLFTYSYNPDGSLATVTYPDTVTVAYTYDCYGYRKGMTVDGQQAWTLGGKNGADIYWHLNGGCSLSHSYDKKGRLVSRTNYTPITISPVDGGLISGDGLNGIGDHGSLPVDTLITDPGTPGVLLGTPVHEMAFTYDHQTGNLTSRTIGGITESFTYDSLDRLTTVTQGSSTPLSVSYADGGNILSKTGLGSYSYDSGKPHAVTGVENTAGLVSDIPQTITYNGIGQATRIHQQAREAVITYGPDETRWKTAFTDTGLTRRLIRYYGDYEEVDSFGPHPGIPAVATKKYHWLPGDVLYVRQGGVGRLCYLATDHLGSIREVMKADGDLTSVFHADYDAWGRQTVSRDSIGIYRGYTGHEMLPEFGLINMNGRMYDPLLGRFLSPDNYVQLPDLSQSFNRYSYCLNNPLKYTDPSGELFGIDDAILIGISFGAIMGSINARMNGENVLWGTLIGGAIGGLSAWAGGFAAAHFQAVGVWGGILSGGATGGVTGMATNVLSTGFTNMANGRSFTDGLGSSALSGLLSGSLTGAISGGIQGYNNAKELGANPWTRYKEGPNYTSHYETPLKDGCPKQQFPSKHCYAYAGQYATTGHNELTVNDFLLSAKQGELIPDGADINVVAKRLGINSESRLDFNIHSLGKGLQKGNVEMILGINEGTTHFVNLLSYNVTPRYNIFGGGFRNIMHHIKVWDPATGNIRRIYQSQILSIIKFQF